MKNLIKTTAVVLGLIASTSVLADSTMQKITDLKTFNTYCVQSNSAGHFATFTPNNPSIKNSAGIITGYNADSMVLKSDTTVMHPQNLDSQNHITDLTPRFSSFVGAYGLIYSNGNNINQIVCYYTYKGFTGVTVDTNLVFV